MGEIKIDIDYGSISNKSKKAIDKAQLWLDNQVIVDSSPYTPFREGWLDGSANIPKPGKVEYNVPHGGRMYYGEHFNFNKSKHPLAGAFWVEKAKAANSGAWVNGVQKIVKGEV